MSDRTRVLILGAGGRDFQVFNTVYREDPNTEVVAITATQIPGIDDRMYPPELSGPLYPNGIQILSENDLETIISEKNVDVAVFAYSDVSYDFVDKMKARVEKAGARFELFDTDATMLHTDKPCVAICAVRTGCGKSAISRYVMKVLQDLGKKPAALRHPMPYGDLKKQAVQRFATIEDLERHECTIEEMEEYEPHIAAGNVIFAGADYAAILAEAEKEADVIIWDGGNNDTPFVKPDLWITILDPLRPGDEVDYYPGRLNLERADVLIINKREQAKDEDVQKLRENIAKYNPKAVVIESSSPVEIADESAVKGKRALVIEDGPTTTHGGMGYGAGWVAAKAAGVAEMVDPRPFVTGEIAHAFEKYTHVKEILPALGYGEQQLADLQATIEKVDCDVVVVGTPIDLSRIIEIKKPSVRVTYSYGELEEPGLKGVIADWIQKA